METDRGEFLRHEANAPRWVCRLGHCPIAHQNSKLSRASDKRTLFCSNHYWMASIVLWTNLHPPRMLGRIALVGAFVSTEKGRNDVGNIPCRPHGVPRAKRGLLIAESLDKWERPPQVEILGKNSRGTVQGLGGLRLSSARPAYKVGLWLSSGSLNFGSIPTISESFMLNTCILSGSLEFWYTPGPADKGLWAPKV